MLRFLHFAVETFDLGSMNFTVKDMIILGAIVASWYSLKERVRVIEVSIEPLIDEWKSRRTDSKARAASGGHQ